MPRALPHNYTAETLPEKYLGAWKSAGGIFSQDIDNAEAFVTKRTVLEVRQNARPLETHPPSPLS